MRRRRMKMRRGFRRLIVALLPFVLLGSAAAPAQSIMRSPSINIPSRIPNINPNLAGRAVTGVGGNGLRVRPPCSAAYRESNGDCSDQPVASTDGGGNSRASNKKAANDTGRNNLQTSLNAASVGDEI